MRKFRTAVLTGIAALAVAGVGLAAVRDTHTVKVALPDGSVARIEYSGDVAPKVSFAPALSATPAGFVGLFDGSPFGTVDRTVAEMERQTEAMVHQAAQLEALPAFADGALEQAALGKLPPGGIHYEFVSTSNRGGGCTRSVEMTSYGSGEKPRVISRVSGDCAQVDSLPTPSHGSIADPGRIETSQSRDSAPAGTTV